MGSISSIKKQIYRIDEELEILEKYVVENLSEIIGRILIENKAALLLEKNRLQYLLQEEELKNSILSDKEEKFIVNFPSFRYPFKILSCEQRDTIIKAYDDSKNDPILLNMVCKYYKLQ
jgi:hypothetical protein